MSVIEKIPEKVAALAKESLERARKVASYMEERAPRLARSIATIGMSATFTAISIGVLASVFPGVAQAFTYLVPLIVMMLQISIAIMLFSLVIGCARRLL